MSNLFPWFMSLDCDSDVQSSQRSRQSNQAREKPSRPDKKAGARRAAPGKAKDERLFELARAIEVEVIPRLLLAHRGVPPHLSGATDAGSVQTGPGPDEAEIEALVSITIASDLSAARTLVESVLSRGVPLELVLEGLMAPAARRLGIMWERDVCTFTDVTVGLSCLQSVLRVVAPDNENEIESKGRGYRILLMPMLGEHHTFGITIVEAFFRRAGWDVLGGYSFDDKSISKIVGTEWLDVVGISASAEVLVANLRGFVESIRSSSINKNLVIMVGGSLVSEMPDLLSQSGADCTGIDGKQAVVHALAAVGRRAGRC